MPLSWRLPMSYNNHRSSSPKSSEFAFFCRFSFLFLSSSSSAICYRILWERFSRFQKASVNYFRWGWIGEETMACRKTPDLLRVPCSHSPRHHCQPRASSSARDQTCCRLLDFWESLLFIPARRMTTGHYCCPSDSTDSLCGSAGNRVRWAVLIMCVYVSDLIQEEMLLSFAGTLFSLAKVDDPRLTAEITFR